LLAETVEFYQLPFQQRRMRIFRNGNTLGQRVFVDASWFKRALHNLIWNAYKFTSDKGQVTLEVHPLDGGLEVVVQDSGRGIPADRLESIFKKSEQVVPEKDGKIGARLGLLICKPIIGLHGGRILVQSTEGRGSRFSLLFPADKIS